MTECPICFNTVAPHDTECNTCGAELDPIESDTSSDSKTKKATTWTSKPMSSPAASFGDRTSKSSGWGSKKHQEPSVAKKPKVRTPRGVAIVQEGTETRPISLLDGKTSIGRDEDHDIVLEDDRVSGFHGIIYVDDNSQRYLDVSTNGSTINGNICHYDKSDLQNGARIEIGNVIITFVLIPSVG